MRKRWIGLVFVLASLIFSFTVYHRLPEKVATHFNASGQADGYSTRLFAAFLMPVVGALMLGVLNLLPDIMPRRENFARFEDTYWFIVHLVVAFMCAMNVVVLGHALGWPVNIPTFVLLAVGGMFTILGTVLPRTRSNWFMGIRTPWTLESDYVWRVTHELAGRTFIIGGIITMIAAFLPAKIQPVIAMIALGIAGFIPVVYSYFAWRREKQGKI